MYTNINVPERLKYVRDQRKKTQKQVAKGIDVKVRTYQAYEEGRAIPPLPALMALSEYYGLFSIDQLLGIGERPASADEVSQAYHTADEKAQQIVKLALNINC